MQDRYAAHDSFIRPAWAARAFWRAIVVIIAFELVFGLSPYVLAAFLPSEALRNEFFSGISAFGTLAQFGSFAIALAGFSVILRLLHGRGLASLAGPRAMALHDFRRAGVATGTLLAVLAIIPPWINPADLEQVRPIGTWLALIPVALVVVTVQVTTEELFFRGYLQQQFAVLSRSPLFWMGGPSLMFGALHFWNGFGVADGVVYAVWATALGLACADLTARRGNIGGAVGLHLANNMFALLIVGVSGWPSSGLALFLYPYEDPAIYAAGLEGLLDPVLIVELILLLVNCLLMWLAARVSLRC